MKPPIECAQDAAICCTWNNGARDAEFYSLAIWWCDVRQILEYPVISALAVHSAAHHAPQRVNERVWCAASLGLELHREAEPTTGNIARPGYRPPADVVRSPEDKADTCCTPCSLESQDE